VPEREVAPDQVAPEGQMAIARRSNAGSLQPLVEKSPGGTTESPRKHCECGIVTAAPMIPFE